MSTSTALATELKRPEARYVFPLSIKPPFATNTSPSTSTLKKLDSASNLTAWTHVSASAVNVVGICSLFIKVDFNIRALQRLLVFFCRYVDWVHLIPYLDQTSTANGQSRNI